MQIFNFENGINEKHIGCSFKELHNNLNNEVPIAYIAGFFDGEGHVGILKHTKNNQYQLVVGFANTDLEILKRIQSLFNNGTLRSRGKRGEKWKIGYELYYNAKNALNVLEAIKSYLIVKKERAYIAIEFYKNFKYTTTGIPLSDKESKIREMYYLKMKELNKRGSDENDKDENDKNKEIFLNDEIEKINNSYKNLGQYTMENY